MNYREALDNPDYYHQYVEQGPNRALNRAFHFLSGVVFHPHIAYMEGSQEAITQHLDEGKPSFVSLNHVLGADIPLNAAIIQHDKALRPLIGNYVTPAKAPLFKNPLAGRLFTRNGAMITYRHAGDVKAVGATVADGDLEGHLGRSQVAMLAGCSEQLNNGGHVIGFWEGTRNKGNATRIQPIKRGAIGVIEGDDFLGLEGVENRDDLMVVFMSTYYGDRDKLIDKLRPAVGIGHLALRDVPRVTKAMVRNGQQAALDLAINTFNG